MAKLSGNIQFTGSLGGYNAFKRKGSDEIIFRKNGGGNRETLATRDSCENTRKEQGEFGGRSTACSLLKHAMQPVSKLAGINVGPNLQTMVHIIQKMDTVSDWGKRGIPFSMGRHLLEGYQVNKINTFNSVVRQPIHYTIDRNTCSATVVLPDLIPGINFNWPWKASSFRFVIALGILPDMEHGTYKYIPVQEPAKLTNQLYLDTAWMPATSAFTGSTVTLQPLEQAPLLHETHSLVLSIGVQGGNWISNALVQPVAYAGCGKILGVA